MSRAFKVAQELIRQRAVEYPESHETAKRLWRLLLDNPEDALAFFNHAYPKSDLVSAGMSEEEREKALTPGLPLAERWKIFAPYWRWIRLTGFSQGILEGFRDLLGFDEF